MRDELARQQAALLAALEGDRPPPPGFDAHAVSVAGAGLADKRRRSAARAWPALARALGGDFTAAFATHVAPTPLAPSRGPLRDGLRLFRALRGDPRLDRAACAEALRVQLAFRETPDGLALRRGPALRLLRAPGSLWMGVRIGRWARVVELGG